MDDELRRLLGTRMADEVVPLIIDQVRASYRYKTDTYSEAHGDDSTVFGIGVSRAALNLVERALEDRTDVRADRPQGSFVIVGENGQQLRCWKVGLTEDADVDAIKWEGSESKKAPGKANTKQLRLELKLEDPPAPGNEMYLSNLVIGHLGNSVDGCCRIVLGTPKEGQGWFFHRDLWRIAEADVVRRTEDFGTEPVLTGDEDDLPVRLRDADEDPTVELRSKDDDDESESGSPETA